MIGILIIGTTIARLANSNILSFYNKEFLSEFWVVVFRLKIKKNTGGGFLSESKDREIMSPEKRRKLEELELARKMREHIKEGEAEKGGTKKKAPEGKSVNVERKARDLKTLSKKPGAKTIERQGHSGSLIKRDRVCRKIIEWGILGLIVWSPLPAASVYEWSILVIQLVVFVMLGAYLLMKHKPQNKTHLTSALKWPKYLFFGLFGLICIQIIPLPNFLLKLLSPKTHFYREYLTPDISGIKFGSFSLIPSYTFREVLSFLPYFILGFLIIKTITQQRQIKKIFYILIGMGVFQALYGFFELYNKNPRILFYEKKYYLDSVTGTFVNRNHLSGYLEMIIPLAIGVVLAHADFFSLTRLKLKEKILHLSDKGTYTNILIPLCIVIMSLAIFFTRSRSGIFLLIFTFLLIFELSVLFFLREEESRKALRRFLQVTFLIIPIFALYIGVDSVIERFSMDNLLHEVRPIFWEQTVDMIGDFPLLGTGLGTFVSVYPIYEEIGSRAQVSHAHNDYLEYLSELGIPGAVFLLGGILFLLVNSFLIWRERRHPQVKGLALGAIVAVLVMLIHSITDFNLHIPANMLLFSVVLSLAAVTSYYRKGVTDQSKDKEKMGQPFKSNQNGKENRYKEEIEGGQKFINGEKKVGLKTILSIFALLVLIVIVIVIYWNQHSYYRGRDVQDLERKIEVLDRANGFYPFNDLVYYELGRANINLGAQNIENNDLRDLYLQESVRKFNRLLRINPLSSFGHFDLAQSLSYMSYLDLEGPFGERTLQEANEEYKKAALLAGQNSQIFHEVGKIFLSNWDELSDDDKQFAVEILRKRVRVVDRDGLLDLMFSWEMNVRDYAVMNAILPQDVQTYYLYARFLGEKSLSIEQRKRILSEAEFMEYEKAREEFKAGENAFMYLRIREATNHYERCLSILERLKFYQNFSGDMQIGKDEFTNMVSTAHLKLAKCCHRAGKELSEIKKHVLVYLELEDEGVAVNELGSYLQRYALLEETLEESRDDLEKLSLHLHLYYKQNRYRDIMRLGRSLWESFIVVPEDEQKKYVEILQLIGDAYQKVEYVYDATEFYNRALMIEPDNLETLLSLRQNFERLREDDEVRKITERIESLMTPRNLDTGGVQIQKGRTYKANLILDGREQRLDLHFKRGAEHLKPLISIFFNGRVVWEDYVEDEVLSVAVQSEEGENRLIVSPINMDIQLNQISYE